MLFLSIPLIMRMVPPNLLYGFRTKKTLSNKDIWYQANKFSGKGLLVISLFGLVGSLVLFLVRDNLSLDLMSWIAAVGILLPLWIVFILSSRYVKKI